MLLRALPSRIPRSIFIGQAKQCKQSSFLKPALRLLSTEPQRQAEYAGAGPNSDPDAPLEGVTVVKSVRDAVQACVTLHSLPENLHVAWSAQIAPLNRQLEPRTLSAYAGNQVDFGNGPHLFVNASDGGSENEKVWEVFKRYFEDHRASKIWFNYSEIQPILSKKQTIPVGFSGDLASMASLMEKEAPEVSIPSFAQTYLLAQERRKCVSVGSFRAETDLGAVSRPWLSMKQKKKKPIISNEWVVAACVDSVATLSLYEALKKKLEDISVLNNLSRSRTEFDTMFDMYREVFVPLVHQLYQIQQNEIRFDRDILENSINTLSKEIQEKESKFLDWVKSFSPGGERMNPHDRKQLRHVLFSPCINKHDKTESLGREMTIPITAPSLPVSKSETAEANGTLKIYGYGAEPREYLTSGWPSMSTKALQKAVKSGRDGVIGFEKNDDGFCTAVESIMQAKECKTMLKEKQKQLRELSKTNMEACLSYGLERAPTMFSLVAPQKKYQELVRSALLAAPGNMLVQGQYLDLEQELLFVFSGCPRLRTQLENGDVHEQLAIALFDDVREAHTNGTCVVRRRGEAQTFDQPGRKSVSNLFPDACRLAEKLSWCMMRRHSPKVVKSYLKADDKEVRRLMRAWRKLYPEVLNWQDGILEQAVRHSSISSLLGRKMKIRTRASRTGRSVVSWEVLDKLMTASLADVMSQALIKCGKNETLAAVGWRVAALNKHGLLLEGPAHAVRTAKSTVQSEMEELQFGFNFNTYCPIRVQSGTHTGRLVDE